MTSFLRQQDIVDPELLTYPITVIGLGGIGSFTTQALGRMGFKNFTLWDHDRIESHNVPNQNYDAGHIGMNKVAAAQELIARIAPEAKIQTNWSSFPMGLKKKDELEGIVISAVDRMDSRKAIWHCVRESQAFVTLFLDGRLGVAWNEKTRQVTGEWLEVFTLNPAKPDDIELWESHYFEDREAAPLRCTAQAVVYLGNFMAAFMASNIKKWVRREKFPRHLLFDALNLKVVCATI